MTRSTAAAVVEDAWPAIPRIETIDPFQELDQQRVLFIGGSKDGQVLTVPFEDGRFCFCVELRSQVVLRPRSQETVLRLPVDVERYRQHALDHDGRRVAVSPDLMLSRYCQEVDLPQDLLSVEAAQKLRSAIRAHVSAIGGRLLPPAVGHEDVRVQLVPEVAHPTGSPPSRVLRGECWLTEPARQVG